MNVRELISAFVAYADEALVPKLNALGRNAFYFAVGVLLDSNDLEAKLSMLGAVRGDGTVDVGKLESGVMFMLDKAGAPVDIGGFSFSREDAEAFFRRTRESSAAQPD